MKAYSEKQKKNKKTPQSLWYSHCRQVKESKNLFILSGNNRAITEKRRRIAAAPGANPAAYPAQKKTRLQQGDTAAGPGLPVADTGSGIVSRRRRRLCRARSR
jgi:hypothetical protein